MKNPWEEYRENANWANLQNISQEVSRRRFDESPEVLDPGQKHRRLRTKYVLAKIHLVITGVLSLLFTLFAIGVVIATIWGIYCIYSH